MLRPGIMVIGMALYLGLWGCAQIEVAKPPPPAPREIIPVYFYVGTGELNLKDGPDEESENKSLVRLNEKVQEIKKGTGGWFMVSTEDGRTGWASSRYLELKPVTNLYVAKTGACLRTAPDLNSQKVGQLRVNDQVKLLDPKPRSWVEVAAERTKDKGWLEVKYLSKEAVVFKQYRKKAKKGKETDKAKEGVAKEGPAPRRAPSAPGAL